MEMGGGDLGVTSNDGCRKYVIAGARLLLLQLIIKGGESRLLIGSNDRNNFFFLKFKIVNDLHKLMNILE